MTPLDITILVAALFLFLGTCCVALLLRVDLSGRGEVADVPEVEDIPQTGFDEHADMAGRLVSRDYPTTPDERRFADDIENFLKELAR